MKIGILGKPSSGKSTFFSAATLQNVEIAEYPFTTIKPNMGNAYVTANCPCKKFKLKNCSYLLPLKNPIKTNIATSMSKTTIEITIFSRGVVVGNGLYHTVQRAISAKKPID